MEKRESVLKAFDAIVTFVNDLWNVYGNPKKVDGLSLYRRIIEHIKFTDTGAINKAIRGFEKFFTLYETRILENKLDEIPRGETIRYGKSDTIYIDIQKFIYKADPDTKSAIRQHLVTISAILEPDSHKIKELENRISELELDESKEGQFISGILSSAKESVEGADVDNPMSAVMGLLQGGVIENMMSGFASGDMDMEKLLGSMQTTIGSLMNADSGDKIQEVTDE